MQKNPALSQGIIFGVILGFVHLANGSINNLSNLDAPGNDLLNKSFMGFLVVLFLLAGWRGVQITGQLRTGALAGLWTGVVGSLLGLISLWIITFAFMETIRHNTFMIQDFQRSGMSDMDAFIIEDALGASFFGSMFSLVLGAGMGALGGLLGKLATPLQAQS